MLGWFCVRSDFEASWLGIYGFSSTAFATLLGNEVVRALGASYHALVVHFIALPCIIGWIELCHFIECLGHVHQWIWGGIGRVVDVWGCYLGSRHRHCDPSDPRGILPRKHFDGATVSRAFPVFASIPTDPHRDPPWTSALAMASPYNSDSPLWVGVRTVDAS